MSPRALERCAPPRGRVASPWTVYMLECSNRAFYTGITNDVPRRVSVHQSGRGSSYTAAHRPLRLVYEEPHQDRGSALRREAELRRWTHARKAALIRRRAA